MLFNIDVEFGDNAVRGASTYSSHLVRKPDISVRACRYIPQKARLQNPHPILINNAVYR